MQNKTKGTTMMSTTIPSKSTASKTNQKSWMASLVLLKQCRRMANSTVKQTKNSHSTTTKYHSASYMAGALFISTSTHIHSALRTITPSITLSKA